MGTVRVKERRIQLQRKTIDEVEKKKKPVETKQPEEKKPTTTENVPVVAGQQEKLVLQQQQTEAKRLELAKRLETKQEVSAERRAQIESFDRDEVALPNGAVEPPQIEGVKVANALKGKSELGALNEAEKKILLDASMKRWTGEDRDPSERKVDNKAIDELARQVDDNPEARATVGKYYLNRAAEKIEARTPDQQVLDRTLATSLTANAIVALPDVAERRQVLEELGPKRAALLMNEVSQTPSEPLSTESIGKSNGITNRVEVANALLESATIGKPTETSSAIVDVAFANLGSITGSGPEESGRRLAAGDNMAKALALHWYPDDEQKQSQEAERLTGVLRTHQGLELLAGEPPKTSHETRLVMLDLFRRHPEWDAKKLQETSSGFTNATIMAEVAQPRIDQYQQLRGDTPQVLSKTNLENTIGFSMNLPLEGIPENETEEQREQREQRVAEGDFSYFNGEKTAAIVTPIANTIRDIGGDDPKVTVLPIQFSSRDTGTVQLPLFRVEDKAGVDRFVDNQGRSYASFEAWKQENQMPYGIVVHPPNGHLTPNTKAEASWTPKSSNTEQAKEVVDGAVLVGGIVAGGAIILGSGGTMAPVVLGAGAAWSAYRSGETLVDRYQHEQSIDPTKDAGARGAWINLAAGSLSFAGLGASGIAKSLVTSSKYGPMAATTAGILNVSAASVDAISAGNAGYTLIANWDRLSGAERAQLALSVGFWGVSSAAMAKTTGSITAPYHFKAIRQTILADSASMPDPEYANALKPRIDAAVEAYKKRDYETVERLLTDREFADRLGVTLDKKTMMMDVDPTKMTKQDLDSMTSAARSGSFSFEDKRLVIYDAFFLPNGDPSQAAVSGGVPRVAKQLSPIMMEEWMHQLQQSSGRPISKLTGEYLKEKGLKWSDEHHEMDIIAAFYEWGFPVDQIGTARAYPERRQFQDWYRARGGR